LFLPPVPPRQRKPRQHRPPRGGGR